MATADIIDGRIVVDVDYSERVLIKQVPGASWSLRNKRWEVPLTWGGAVSLRGVFGESLTLTGRITDWGFSQLRRVTALTELKSSPTPGGAYGYQQTGVGFLKLAGSALLADEPGLGKTRQAILSLEEQDYPVLVVCPKTLLYTWEEEWKKWSPQRTVAVVTGTAEKKRQILQSKSDVYVLNYEALRTLSRLAPYGSIRLTVEERVPQCLNLITFGTVIADEAHRTKDPKAKQTRALWAVGHAANRRIALTGTPVANSPLDLWSLLHFLSPDEWRSRSAFIDRYCQTSANFWGGLEVQSLRSDTAAEFDRIFQPRFLRRQKCEVLTQLPPKTYQTRWVSMTPPQQKTYNKLQKEMLAEVEGGTIAAFDSLGKTIRLIQAASSTLAVAGETVTVSNPSCKIDALLELVDEVQQPMVVFAVSRKLIELTAAECTKKGISHVLITGGQTARERAEAVSTFQNGGATLALATMGAGGEGITLTKASTVVFLQRSWSLVQNLQAEDRLHRVGQTDTVNVIDVVTRDSIEESVHRTFQGKEANLQEIVKDPVRFARFLKGDTDGQNREKTLS